MPSQNCEAVSQEPLDQRLHAVVERVNALAAPVQHQVVRIHRGVLVAAERAIPLELGRVRAVQRGELRSFDRGTRHRPDRLGAPAHPRDREAAEVNQRLADLGDLPIEHRDDRAAAIEQEVAEVIVGVHKAGRTRLWKGRRKRRAQLLKRQVEVNAGAFQQRVPTHQVGGELNRTRLPATCSRSRKGRPSTTGSSDAARTAGTGKPCLASAVMIIP